MNFTDAEWTMALLAQHGERQRLADEIAIRRSKLALPLTAARKRVNPQHELALSQLREDLDAAEQRLIARRRVLAAAGIPDPDGLDDTAATNTVALLRWQTEQQAPQ